MGGLRIAALAFAVVSVALSSFASASTDDIVATRAFFVSESQYNDAFAVLVIFAIRRNVP
jgi:hypothetical protein